MKRYVSESGSDAVRSAMAHEEVWCSCRIGFVETIRAVSLAAGRATAEAVRREWPAFTVVEVNQDLVEHASELTLTHDLRSLDALHLAAALLLPPEDLIVATWDRRLHAAVRAHDLTVLPAAPP